MITKEMVMYHLQHLKQLVFEVTSLCNLNCKYCSYADLYKSYGKREPKMLSFEKARMILDYLFLIRDCPHDVNFPLTISFYGGEPLLNIPLIRQIVDYIEIAKPKTHFSYSMTTNGMLLDKYMNYLAEKKFKLLISLDGDKTAQSYRVDHSGENSFEHVFRNVKLLQEKHPDYFQNYVMFNSVFHNLNNIESTFRFIFDHFGKSPQIVPLNTSGIKEDRLSEFKNMYRNINKHLIQLNNCESIEAKMFIISPRIGNLANYIFDHSGNVYDSFNDLIFSLSKNTSTTGTCIPFSKKMFITINGEILPCERIGHDFVLGLVHDDRVELDIDFIVKMHNSYLSKCTNTCKNCFLKQRCPQCVYCIDNIREESIDHCPYFRNKEKSEQVNNEALNFLREHSFYYEKIMKELIIRA